MELPKPEVQPPAHDTGHAPARDELGLILSRDLFFTDKVRGTAEGLGFRMLATAEMSQARMLIQKWGPQVVVLDLTAGELVAPVTVAAYRQLTGPGTWYVAIGPHVQADLLDAARQAGCQVVLPRSKFSAELPALLRRYFSRPADQPGPPA